MSSYGDLFASGQSIFQFRNEVYGEFLCLFSPFELLHTAGYDKSPSYLAAVRDQPYSYDLDSLHELDVYIYQTSAAHLRDRLDVLGFGSQLLRDITVDAAQDDIAVIEQLLHTSDVPLDLQRFWERQLFIVQNITLESWLDQIREEINGLGIRGSQLLNRGPFFHTQLDERILLRALLEVLDEDDVLTLDLTEVVEAGYMNVDDFTRRRWEENLKSTRLLPIVVTEGSYDATVIQEAIRVLDPHLDGYFRFLDFSSGAEGGAAAAVRVLKSFAAAGISNRIIAIFDNDSAAREVLASIDAATLPAQYAITHYPDTELCSNYPTVGPQGRADMNINGLAGSIELYLGRDSLPTRGRTTYSSTMERVHG